MTKLHAFIPQNMHISSYGRAPSRKKSPICDCFCHSKTACSHTFAFIPSSYLSLHTSMYIYIRSVSDASIGGKKWTMVVHSATRRPLWLLGYACVVTGRFTLTFGINFNAPRPWIRVAERPRSLPCKGKGKQLLFPHIVYGLKPCRLRCAFFCSFWRFFLCVQRIIFHP